MTITNAEWMQENGYKFADLRFEQLNSQKWKIYWGDQCIGRYPKPSCMIDAALNWLDMEHAEHVEPILTDKERKYIEDVCRPFRYKVKSISKMVVDHLDDPTDYYIVIRFFNECHAMFFPSFDGSAMYKGMEDNKWYTPMELGLYEDND